MHYSAPAQTTPRRIRIRWDRIAGLLLVAAAIAAGYGYQSSVSTSSTAAAPSGHAQGGHRAASSDGDAAGSSRADAGALGQAGGALPRGTTLLDDGTPAVANLDPALLDASRQAAADAAPEGIEFVVNGGWRSAAYEDQLRREAISKYGSEEEAARWVATGQTSPHVTGDAIDIGPAEAAIWLSRHGAAYGLCQIYSNEPWHYELRPEATGDGCPDMYADATEDPRLQP